MINKLAALGLVLVACHRDRDASALQGVIELHERQLGFEVPGRIARIVVHRGERVETGQVLAVLDDGMERPQRDAREQDVQAARAQLDLVREGPRREDLRATEAQLRASRSAERNVQEQLARTRALRAQNVVPQSQLDEMDAQAARARAERESLEERLAAERRGSRSQELRVAQARYDSARAALAASDARLDRFVLHAPVAGAILDTAAEPGEVVAAGTPVVILGETRRPYLDVFVAQQDLDGVRVGRKATVRVDPARELLPGIVEDVGRTTEFTPRFLFSPRERQTLVVRVRIAIDDPKELLHAGTPAFATLDQAGSAEARR
jgi:HlyD family secretion protein